MSDANNAAPAATPAPNELDAKLSAITKALEEQNARSAGLENSFQQILAMNQKPAPKEEISPYDADFGDKIARKAAEEASRIADAKLAAERARTATLNTIAMDYPELGNINSEFSKTLASEHTKLAKHLQDTPEGYRLAALSAAANLGIVPKSKRKSTEDFSMSSNGSSGASPKQSSKKIELTDMELGAAELLGLDVNDPKQVERLTKRKAERGEKENWLKYR
jgi:hypothetical protein